MVGIFSYIFPYIFLFFFFPNELGGPEIGPDTVRRNDKETRRQRREETRGIAMAFHSREAVCSSCFLSFFLSDVRIRVSHKQARRLDQQPLESATLTTVVTGPLRGESRRTGRDEAPEKAADRPANSLSMNVKTSRTPYWGAFDREPKSRCWNGEEGEEETLAGAGENSVSSAGAWR